MQIVAILLAAGAGKRFGSDKLIASYENRQLYRHSLESLCCCADIRQTIMVVSPGFEIPAGYPDCRFVVNALWADGMSTSLASGVRAAAGDADAYMIALADMPGITSGLVSAIITHHALSEKKITVPTFKGRNGHPVIINSEFCDELLLLSGDIGAREIICKQEASVSYFETDSEAVIFDIDTPADLCRKRY